MKKYKGIFFNLMIFSLTVFIIAAAAIKLLPLGISINDFLMPFIVFLTILGISLIIFVLGCDKKPQSQPFFTLAALGSKFFFSMLFALVYFVALKNTGTAFILLFFLLYLAFTVYLLRVILKILKIKSLKKA